MISRCLPGFHRPRLSEKRTCRIRLRLSFYYLIDNNIIALQNKIVNVSQASYVQFDVLSHPTYVFSSNRLLPYHRQSERWQYSHRSVWRNRPSG